MEATKGTTLNDNCEAKLLLFPSLIFFLTLIIRNLLLIQVPTPLNSKDLWCLLRIIRLCNSLIPEPNKYLS